jgi:hypothetical protein
MPTWFPPELGRISETPRRMDTAAAPLSARLRRTFLRARVAGRRRLRFRLSRKRRCQSRTRDSLIRPWLKRANTAAAASPPRNLDSVPLSKLAGLRAFARWESRVSFKRRFTGFSVRNILWGSYLPFVDFSAISVEVPCASRRPAASTILPSHEMIVRPLPTTRPSARTDPVSAVIAREKLALVSIVA